MHRVDGQVTDQLAGGQPRAVDHGVHPRAGQLGQVVDVLGHDVAAALGHLLHEQGW